MSQHKLQFSAHPRIQPKPIHSKTGNENISKDILDKYNLKKFEAKSFYVGKMKFRFKMCDLGEKKDPTEWW